MKKGKEIKKIAEKSVRGKFDFKAFLKKVWKISFNTSAVAGVIAAGAMGTARILPRETKVSIEQAIQKFESPVEDIFVDGKACYIQDTRNGGVYPFVNKFKDSEEIKNICLTNEQQKISKPISDKLDDKVYNISQAERDSPSTICVEHLEEIQVIASEFIESMNVIECSPGFQVLEDWNQRWSRKSNATTLAEYDAEHKAWFNNVTLEETSERIKSYHEAKTESDKQRANYIYEKTGEKLPYYDYVNRQIVEEW